RQQPRGMTIFGDYDTASRYYLCAMPTTTTPRGFAVERILKPQFCQSALPGQAKNPFDFLAGRVERQAERFAVGDVVRQALERPDVVGLNVFGGLDFHQSDRPTGAIHDEVYFHIVLRAKVRKTPIRLEIRRQTEGLHHHAMLKGLAEIPGTGMEFLIERPF